MNTYLQRQKVRKERDYKKLVSKLERIILAISAVFAGVAALYGLYALLFFGPFLSVQEILVEGGGKYVSAAEVKKYAGVVSGDNLYWLDVDEVHQRIRQNPWIKTVAVHRRPPNTLWIFVEEFEPRAILAAEELFFVNADGVAFKRVEGKDEKRYPVISGVPVNNQLANHLPTITDQAQKHLQAMLDLMSWFESSGFINDEAIAEVNYDDFRGYSLISSKNATHIFLGEKNLKKQTNILDKYQRAIYKRGREISYISTYQGGRVVVKYKNI